MDPTPRPSTCGHPACACPPSPAHGDHCSAYCANVDVHEGPEPACACGHAACEEAQRVAPAGEEVHTSLGSEPPVNERGEG